jgi:hypothetical protein
MRYAVALLVLTLAAGVYMRASYVWPAVRGTLSDPHLVHAHSHAGFFGWLVMAVAALITSRFPQPTRISTQLHRVLAHAIGIGSFAAFVGFALRGYDTVTIALSALHVLLWVVLATLVWRPLGELQAPTRTYLRAAVAFLVLSGAATMAPVFMMVRAVADPWLLQLGVKLFLTPFVTGFLVLSALGVVYEWISGPRYAGRVLVAIAIGAVPSALLYVPVAPPASWLLYAGRAGLGLVGAGMLLLVADAARSRIADSAGGHRLPPLAWLVIGSAMIAGIVKLLAAFGVGAAFMHNRNIVVAVLHLVLLGAVTPALVLAWRPTLTAPVRTAIYALGLFAMLAPIAASGWPAAARYLVLSGISLDTMFAAAAIGGAITMAALLALTVEADAEPDLSRSAVPPQRPGSGRSLRVVAPAHRRRTRARR